MNRIVLSFAAYAVTVACTHRVALAQSAPAQTSAAAAAAPAGKGTPPIWMPDPSQANALGPEVKVLAYSVRVPLGYHEVTQPVDIQELRKNGVDSHLYSHDRLPDGTAPSFGITVATLPDKYAGKVAVTDALEHIVSQKKDAWKDFSNTKAERGTIGGLTFLRTYYKGTLAGPNGNVEVRGIAYAAVEDKSIIGFEVEDVATHYDATRPVVEAAIMTLRKQ